MQLEGDIESWPKLCRPNFFRDVNKQTFGPMKARPELRDRLRKIDKQIFSLKKHYHTSSRQHFLKMFTTVASLPKSQQLFIEFTNRAVKYSKMILDKCEGELQRMNNQECRVNLTVVISERKKQIKKINAMYQLLKYLRFEYDIDNQQIHKYMEEIFIFDGYSFRQRQRIDQMINQYNIQKIKKETKIRKEVNKFIQQFQQSLYKLQGQVQQKT